MNRADVKILGEYVRWVANEMGLQNWHFEILASDEVPEGGLPHEDDSIPVAGCSPIPGQHKATITFRHDFKDEESPEDQREVVVHELIHCHLADMREFMRTGVLTHVTQQTYNALDYGFSLAWEHAVDDMSRAWAKKMPLISWKTATKGKGDGKAR